MFAYQHSNKQRKENYFNKAFSMHNINGGRPTDSSVSDTKGILKVRAILEYSRCVIGNAGDTWSYCSSRSDIHAVSVVQL